MKISFKPSAIKELGRLPEKIQKSILEKIKALADNPRPPGAIKLTNSDLYRIRVSTYRVIYEINDEEIKIVIIRIRHRREAYGK
jgi:mRNA interferase RelE/StbE